MRAVRRAAASSAGRRACRRARRRSGRAAAESAFGVAGGDVEDPDIRERPAVEDDAAHRLRVSAHVRLRERRAVRGPVEVDLPYPIVRRTVSRSLGRPRWSCTAADLYRAAAKHRAQILRHCPRIRSAHVRVGAGKPARTARAALVDHDEVAVSPDPRKGGIHPYRGRRRRAAGAALEIEERSGRRLLCRRQHRDSQGIVAPCGLRGSEATRRRAHHRVEIAAVSTRDESEARRSAAATAGSGCKTQTASRSQRLRDPDQQPDPARG